MELSKKNTKNLADFKTTIAATQAGDPLELEEVFTFYTLKVNHIRIWTVCRSLNKRNR